MVKAIRVYNGLFSNQPLRAGDILGCCNFLEYIREQQNDPTMQLYMPDEVIFPGHVKLLRDWLIEHTDYITTNPEQLVELQVIPGTDPTYSTMYNIWNIRKDVLIRRQNVFDIPDAVKITNRIDWKDKIVIAPLMDAEYNFERNWTLHYTQKILDEIIHNPRVPSAAEYLILSQTPIHGLDLGHRWKYSHDYRANMEHIREAMVYVGGDTGLSHFAGAVDSLMYRQYHYSTRTYGTTCPLNFRKNGEMVYY